MYPHAYNICRCVCIVSNYSHSIPKTYQSPKKLLNWSRGKWKLPYEAKALIHPCETIKEISTVLFTKSPKSMQRKIFWKLDYGLPREETVCYLSLYPQHLAWLAHSRSSRNVCWTILLKLKRGRGGTGDKVEYSFSLGKSQSQKSMNRVKKGSFTCMDNSYTIDCFRDIRAIQGPSLDLLRSSLWRAITMHSQNASSLHQQGPNSKLYKALISPCLTLLSPVPSRLLGTCPVGSMGIFYSGFHQRREKPRRWCPSNRSKNGCISQGNQRLGLVFLSPQQGGH